MAELETEVKLLKKELQDQAKIHDRLDIAIEKLTDVSNSIHRMLAVHEEKISRQEEATLAADAKIEIRRTELTAKIDDLHSRITTNTKEIMSAAAVASSCRAIFSSCTASIRWIELETSVSFSIATSKRECIFAWSCNSFLRSLTSVSNSAIIFTSQISTWLEHPMR